MTCRRILCSIVLLLATAVLSPHPASAVVYLDINATSGKRLGVAVPGFVAASVDPALGKTLSDVVAGDLALTQVFNVVAPDAYLEKVSPAHFVGTPLSFSSWKMIGAEGVVIGKVEKHPSADSDKRFADWIVVEMRLYDATMGTMLVGKRYQGPARRHRMIAHKFANEVFLAYTGVRGNFDTEIAFTARPDRGRDKEVFLIGMDGKDLRPMTDDRGFNLFPRWSPDGQSIAFTSFRTGVPVILLRDLSTGRDRPVVSFGNTKAPGAFSPNGDVVYASVSVEGNSDIYRVKLDGTSIEKVADGFAIEVSPTLSPDGGKMAFVSDRGGSPQIYVKEIGGAEAKVSRSGNYATSPSWSPDGKKIAYTSRVGGKFSLYTVSPDGNDELPLASGDGDCLDPSWSPDGRHLVYTHQKKGYAELKIVSADGKWERVLLKQGAGLSDIGSPSWSPRR